MEESYNPNNLAHQEPLVPLSEWQEFNDLDNERDWGTIEEGFGKCLSCKDLPPELDVSGGDFWELLV